MKRSKQILRSLADEDVKLIAQQVAAILRDAVTNKPVRHGRDLSKAITLRPAEVFALYGINQVALCRLAKHADASKRLPSILIGSKAGRRGIRLINHDELRAFLARHAT